MRVPEMFSDHRMFMFLYVLMEMAASVSNIICIAQITYEFLSQECKNLKEIFLKLKYPEKLINSAINRLQHPKDPVQTPSESPVQITLPFQDQK